MTQIYEKTSMNLMSFPSTGQMIKHRHDKHFIAAVIVVLHVTIVTHLNMIDHSYVRNPTVTSSAIMSFNINENIEEPTLKMNNVFPTAPTRTKDNIHGHYITNKGSIKSSMKAWKFTSYSEAEPIAEEKREPSANCFYAPIDFDGTDDTLKCEKCPCESVLESEATVMAESRTL